MIDLENLEKNFEKVAKILFFRGVNIDDLKRIRYMHLLKKNKISLINKLRGERNNISCKKIKGNFEVLELKNKIKKEEEENLKISSELEMLCSQIPNIPSSTTPNNEIGNQIIKEVYYSKKRKNSLICDKIIKKIGIIDIERSIKLSGNKFVIYKNLGVKLLHSLINFMIYENEKKGFSLISSPYIVKNQNLYNTGQFPKFSNDIFKIENHDLSLIPTSEVTLVNLYSNEIINESDLPIKICSYSPCFRREVGSAGQENKGLIRLHQFNKVEIVSITIPDNSYKQLEEIVSCASSILDRLEISYRVVNLCYSELGISSAKTYDIEVWLPNSKKWLEISSCTNCEDFQSNRANIRTKKNGKKIKLHTLNGSSLAIDRLILAILEYYYDEEKNELMIPSELTKYIY